MANFRYYKWRYWMGAGLLLLLLAAHQWMVRQRTFDQTQFAQWQHLIVRQQMGGLQMMVLSQQMTQGQAGAKEAIAGKIDQWKAQHDSLRQTSLQLPLSADQLARIGQSLQNMGPSIAEVQRWAVENRANLPLAVTQQSQWLGQLNALEAQVGAMAKERLDAREQWECILRLLSMAVVVVGLFVFYQPVVGKLGTTAQDLWAANNKLAAILNSTTDSNMLIGPDFTLLSFNRRAQEVNMVAGNELMQEGRSVWHYIPEAHKQSFADDLAVVFAGGQVHREELIELGPHRRWFMVRIYPAVDCGGQLIGAAFNATDIHDKKVNEEAHKNLEQKWRTIVQTAPVMILVGDARGNIVLANHMACTKLGYPIGGLEGKNFKQLWTSFDPDNANCGTKTGGHMAFNCPALTAQGQLLEVEGALSGLQIDGKPHQMLMLLDQSEHKKALEKVQHQDQRLRGIAWLQNHELRRPVANLLALVDLLTNDAEADYHPQYLDALQQCAQEMDEIIHRIVEETVEPRMVVVREK